MVGRLFDWLDHRTGYLKLREAMLLEHIPGGAKWRYVWGSALAFVFGIQLITGVLLMFHYSPGDSTAWGSVYFIQYQMDFGWLIRGLHHFGSQTMVVLLGLHMLQVVIAGAHLPPREVNWWLGLALLGVVLGLSLTGYLLPWDQKGFWATQVATNIASSIPLLGPFLQRTLVGGAEYGHHTLTHFYALHVGILPPLLIVLLILHIMVFRRHGVTAPRNAQGVGLFWPDQAFRDMLVSMVIFAVMLGLVIYGHGNPIERPDAQEAGLYERIAHAGQWGQGAHLDAPADLQTEEYEARPEWYFLFLFQLLKYFQGDLLLVGTVVIPFGVLLLLAVLPLLGYGRMRAFGHLVGVFVVVALLGMVGVLTYQALDADRNDKGFQEKMETQEALARRVVRMGDKIPEEGAKYLLRRDPLTAGPKLFERYCAICHLHGGEVILTKQFQLVDPKGKPVERDKAPDLTGFGTKDWIHRFLSNPDDPDFLGRTHLLAKKKKEKVPQSAMQRWIDENFPYVSERDEDLKKLSADEREILKKDRADLTTLAGWLARHPRKTPENDKDVDFQRGVQLFQERGCVTCHKYEGQGSTTGPDLTGYAGADWIRGMIMAPQHPSRYGLRNRMFIFREFEGSNKEQIVKEEVARIIDLAAAERVDFDKADIERAHKLAHLSDIDREIIIRYLTRDNRVVFAGDLLPPKR